MTPAPGRSPPRLSRGSHLRILAPARSLQHIAPRVRAAADERLRGLGFALSFGHHVEEKDEFNSTSVAHRVADLHAAWEDPAVQGMLTVIGGYNSNQLLRSIDYRLLERNPKVFCGYSDITALHLAIHAKTGHITYYGPHYSNFGDVEGADYSVESFLQTTTTADPFEVSPSRSWSEDAWFLPAPVPRHFPPNPGPRVLQPGKAEGVLLGGNLCTVNLLQGTEYLPDLAGALVFVEDVGEAATPPYFDRNLQSLLHQKGGDQIAGLLIGRFQSQANMTDSLLEKIVASKPELEGIPVVSGFDFGHTTPMMTLPMGGRGSVEAADTSVRLRWLDH